MKVSVILFLVIGISSLYSGLSEVNARVVNSLYVTLEDDTIKQNSFINADNGVPVITIQKEQTLSFPLKVISGTSEPLPVNFIHSIEYAIPETRRTTLPDMKIELEPFHMVLKPDEPQILNVTITAMNYTQLGEHRVTVTAQEPQGVPLLNTGFDVLVINMDKNHCWNKTENHARPCTSFESEQFFDFMGSAWMESKHQEMSDALQSDTLHEWVDQTPNHYHWNVYQYYSNTDDYMQYLSHQSPLKQIQSGIPFDEIQCKDGLVLLQKYDGTPACVTEQTSEELTKRDWGISGKLLSLMVEKADDIVTVWVAGEENHPSGNRNVWLSSYEWLKSGIYDEEQLFLEQSQTSPARYVEFDRGEEALLFLKEVDEKRGAYDLTSAEILPQKYPLKLRDRIANIVNASYDQQKTEDNYKDNDRCIKKEFNGDAYWHCSSPRVSFAVPIEITVSKIQDEMLKHVSQSYLDEHFNLISTADRTVVNGKETPVGQYLEFIYSIDGLNFRYDVSTKLERDFDEVYLRFTPPKEIDSIIHDTQKIDELIYLCLEPDTYKILWQPYMVANHVEDGFSPYLTGHSPPTVRDRWGDDPIQRSETTFRVWLVNGDVECKESSGEFVPDKFARDKEILLIDSTEFNRIKEN